VDGWLPWLLGTGVVLLLAVAGMLARSGSRGRPARPAGRRTTRPGTRPARPTRAPSRPSRPVGPSRPATRPLPGEIWWADVPYEDGTGSKVRPCLVLRTRRGGADVLKITSQDKSDRSDHVRLPTRRWDPRADRDSYLEVAEPIRLRAAAFARRAGTCDPAVWRGVRRLHGVRPGR
jgi:hypothetical protein